MSKLVAEYKGQTKSLYEWSRITGIAYKTLCNRYMDGDRGEDLFRRTTKAVCKICGKVFASKIGNKKCCSDECAKENARRNANLCAERKKLQPKKEKKLTITEIAVMAKEAGMSYGQYSAMLALRNK